jgi:hypothetical protein
MKLNRKTTIFLILFLIPIIFAQNTNEKTPKTFSLPLIGELTIGFVFGLWKKV